MIGAAEVVERATAAVLGIRTRADGPSPYSAAELRAFETIREFRHAQRRAARAGRPLRPAARHYAAMTLAQRAILRERVGAPAAAAFGSETFETEQAEAEFLGLILRAELAEFQREGRTDG